MWDTTGSSLTIRREYRAYMATRAIRMYLLHGTELPRRTSTPNSQCALRILSVNLGNNDMLTFNTFSRSGIIFVFLTAPFYFAHSFVVVAKGVCSFNIRACLLYPGDIRHSRSRRREQEYSIKVLQKANRRPESNINASIPKCTNLQNYIRHHVASGKSANIHRGVDSIRRY